MILTHDNEADKIIPKKCPPAAFFTLQTIVDLCLSPEFKAAAAAAREKLPAPYNDTDDALIAGDLIRGILLRGQAD